MGGVAWSEEEDQLLRKCIEQYGEGKWHRIPILAGINRCRKSCRLRWLNYLRPNIRRGKFTDEEVEIIIKLHNLLGNRWSLIASRLSGRTANDVKNFWHCHLSKRLNSHLIDKSNVTAKDHTQYQVVMENSSVRNEVNDKSYIQHHDHVPNTASSKEIVPICVQDITCQYDNNNVHQPKDDKFLCEENMILEELPMDIDFELDEIKITIDDQMKYNWGFDDLLFDMEI
ncbi:hypothetical protein RND81_12G157100 [Saponaria officinalis]|uniref:Transcription factor MYB1 n=1 Tax=Saponaria officinalis TaxID=3572 RepID=A0AAW1HBA4_SAPOF